MKAWIASAALLGIAALLEVLGDALVRIGMRGSAMLTQSAGYLGGAAVLFAYGWVVNRPGWDFGQLLGAYVAVFFVLAQGVNYVVFDVRPSAPVLVGGALVIAGGLVIALWRD
jgi:drug/metabolite transporter superfamily protein YnfA